MILPGVSRCRISEMGKNYYHKRRILRNRMKNLRQLIFFYLISLTGLLWAAFLLLNSDWFYPGLCMIGMILATNVVVLILWIKS
ncbi:hypothetical protein Mboo_1867 [Methanoregula boonei 6A8]|uniref:Uncharacterized protein n=2 Tax=Methanoregula TaxID=395331 RepID=A7I9H1_METB6|nr:hypothetical protein Mboo_1867 [Methanoregula boonei 6A8]